MLKFSTRKRKIFFAGMILLLAIDSVSCSNKSRLTVDRNAKVESVTGVQQMAQKIIIDNFSSSGKRNKIVFDKEPRRVVVDQQNNIEMLLELGKEKSIVGASCTSSHTTGFLERFQTRAKTLPAIRKQDFDRESVLILRPDFIIAWQSAFRTGGLGDTEFWNHRGINTYLVENANSVLSKGGLEAEYRYIRNMGKIFHEEKKAESIVQNCRQKVKEYRRQISLLPQQKVALVENTSRYLMLYGSNKLGGNMIESLGGKLVEGQGIIPAELLIEENPDIIFIVCIGWKEDSEREVKSFLGDRRFQSISAVKNQRVFAIPLMDMYASGIRTLEGIEVFAHGLLSTH